MAEGLSFTAKGAIAVIVILILAGAYGKAPKIAQAAFETTDGYLEEVGVNIFSFPKILSVNPSLQPDGSLAVNWILNKDAKEKISDSSIKAEFSYKRFPDDVIDDVCVVHNVNNIISQDVGWDCGISGSKAVLKRTDCGSEKECLDKTAGLHKVLISFEKKEDGKTLKGGKDLEPPFAFYTEDYVELLDKPLLGCYDDFGNCNVFECKKNIINFYFENPQAPGALQWRKDLVVKISEEFRKEKGFGLGNGCGIFVPYVGGKINLFGSDGCTPEDIDALNIKVARARLLEEAVETTGQEVKSEDDYSKRINMIGLWKEGAIATTMSCTRTWNKFTTIKPKGAFSEIEKLGWSKAGNFDQWEGKIKAELDRVLREEVNPSIANLRADAFEGYKLGLSWGLAKTPDGLVLGEKKVKEGSYKISHFHTRWAGAITTENQKTERPKSPYSIKGEGSGGSIVTSFATDAGELTGKHEFEVSILDGKGNELAIAKAATGMFDDAYIETYKGSVEGGCVTKGLGKDPTGLHECNVYAQKREEMKALRTPAGKEKRDKVFAAMAKAGVAAKCKYEATGVSLHYWLSEECTPEEVDRVWKNYLIEIGRADDYDCVKPLSSESDNVCRVKRQTVNSLTVKGWKDLRVNKGWEANV